MGFTCKENLLFIHVYIQFRKRITALNLEKFYTLDVGRAVCDLKEYFNSYNSQKVSSFPAQGGKIIQLR